MGKGRGQKRPFPGDRSVRPELQARGEEFYGAEEATRYTASAPTIRIQHEITECACDLAVVADARLGSGGAVVLDLGCGSCLSGEVLGGRGWQWLGTDVSSDMLGSARGGHAAGRTAVSDMGDGVPVRDGCLDAVVSASALQWACYECEKAGDSGPLDRLFRSLARALRPGAPAVCQVYVDEPAHLGWLRRAAARHGLAGALLLDMPHKTPTRKYFLCLVRGGAPGAGALPPPAAPFPAERPAGEPGAPRAWARQTLEYGPLQVPLGGGLATVATPMCPLAWPHNLCCTVPWHTFWRLAGASPAPEGWRREAAGPGPVRPWAWSAAAFGGAAGTPPPAAPRVTGFHLRHSHRLLRVYLRARGRAGAGGGAGAAGRGPGPGPGAAARRVTARGEVWGLPGCGAPCGLQVTCGAGEGADAEGAGGDLAGMLAAALEGAAGWRVAVPASETRVSVGPAPREEGGEPAPGRKDEVVPTTDLDPGPGAPAALRVRLMEVPSMHRTLAFETRWGTGEGDDPAGGRGALARLLAGLGGAAASVAGVSAEGREGRSGGADAEYAGSRWASARPAEIDAVTVLCCLPAGADAQAAARAVVRAGWGVGAAGG